MNFAYLKRTLVIPLVLLAAAALLGGCEDTVLETRSTQQAAHVEIAPEGAIDCQILCVSDVAKDARAHAGRVALQGVVSRVFADRRAFTVANIVEGARCCPTGCGNDSIPARVPADQYVGDLPAEFERVIVVGEVIPNGEGYDFVIEEVWAGGKVVLKRQR